MIETIPIASLILDPANARKHSPKNLDAIKGSLARFGQQKPIVISQDNIVIAGNGTLEAAKALGWKDIQVNRSELTGVEATAYAIADNRTGELAEWDGDVLGKTLQSLKAENFDLDAIGFSDEDLKQWVKEAEVIPGCGEDDVPNAEEVETRCKLGDLWSLGGHRLLCGDSTDVLQVERLMGGEKADMVFTDPPYGLGKKWSGGTWASNPMYQDAKEWDAKPLEQSDIDWILTLAPIQIIWGANYYKMPASRCWLAWDKSNKMKTMADFELAYTNFDKVAKSWTGARNVDGKRSHPTQKPVELMQWAIEVHASPKNILDLFLGSGSTLIACEKTGRKCRGMELDPHYCDVIISRWEKFTSKTATLLSE